MNNPEFQELKKKFLLSSLVILIFTIPTIFIFLNKFGMEDSKIIKSINNQENIVILVTNESCNNCKEIENILKQNKVNYIILNKDRDKNYQTILRKLNITETDLLIPSLIYAEGGKISSIYADINDESDLNYYIEYNNLNNQ